VSPLFQPTFLWCYTVSTSICGVFLASSSNLPLLDSAKFYLSILYLRSPKELLQPEMLHCHRTQRSILDLKKLHFFVLTTQK
jgi:hypothetical protein